MKDKSTYLIGVENIFFNLKKQVGGVMWAQNKQHYSLGGFDGSGSSKMGLERSLGSSMSNKFVRWLENCPNGLTKLTWVSKEFRVETLISKRKKSPILRLMRWIPSN